VSIPFVLRQIILMMNIGVQGDVKDTIAGERPCSAPSPGRVAQAAMVSFTSPCKTVISSCVFVFFLLKRIF
jgi:hypothetical protein